MHALYHASLEPLGAASRRFDQPPRIGDRLRIRTEHLVGDGDLTGMDQRLAVKTQRMARRTLALKPGLVVQPVEHAIEHGDPRRPRREYDRLHGEGQTLPPGQGRYPEVLPQIVIP